MKMRTESEIFKDLENLCTKPGYAYVIAYLNFRDNFIHFDPENIKSDDFLKLYDHEKLIPTEIAMLAGLAVKGEFKTDPISPEEIKHLAEQTYHLMKELHKALEHESNAGIFESIEVDSNGKPIPPKNNPFEQAHIWREPIFYASEQAYTFQYREFAPLKYAQDDEWLQKHKGFCIQDVQTVVKALHKIQSKKINYIPIAIQLARTNGKKAIVESLPFHAFTFTLDEIVKQSNCLAHTVESVVRAFCLDPSPCNQGFNRLGDFNNIIANPIIKISNNEYLLLQHSKLIEAMYESPFYWMIKDKDYRNVASKHRGNFTEQFCADRLKSVFGEQNVHKNVTFANNKGEIDVLVTYSNRAIVLQAKSKKLTLEARKGNDSALKNDFQDAIQDAYNQGIRCAELLNNKKINLLDVNGKPLELGKNFREIYIFTVVSDNYPSLVFQANRLLKFKTTHIIPPPFVTDIFFMDVLCELIEEPLYFLDFVQRRSKYFNRVLADDELTILAHHLKHNLYVPNDINFMHIDSDFCAHIDRVMHIRRENLPSDPNMGGILTKFKSHTFSKDQKSFPNSQTALRPKKKIGRNELCPCGSGKKFKRCCLPNFTR